MKKIRPRFILSSLAILLICIPVIYFTLLPGSLTGKNGTEQNSGYDSLDTNTGAGTDGSAYGNSGGSTDSSPDAEDDSADSTDSSANASFVILIDPGHGGYDPGKVGEDGVLEKDINLQISQKLASLLRADGYTVYLTRDSDISLNPDESGSKKNSDLRARMEIAEDKCADLYICIHQNSFSSADVHGGQVFYYETSSEGKALAETIQRHLAEDADPTNTRSAKGNSEYIVLSESPCTSVIVECGFLSNTDECARLQESAYQQSIASAICNAVNEWRKAP